MGPWAGRRLHFVGMGGAGMSGLALVAHALGATVTGSDRAAGSPYAGPLAAAGLRTAVGHAADNVPDGGAQAGGRQRPAVGRAGGAVRAGDARPERVGDEREAAHARSAHADEVQPAPGPRSHGLSP